MPWVVSDYVVWYRNTQLAETTDATLVFTFTPPAGGQVWRVEQITCVCTSVAETEFLVFTATPGPGVTAGLAPASGTMKGNLTFATFDPPITVPQGGQLVLVWKGASAGSLAYARVQVQIMSGTAGQPSPVAA